MRIDKDILVIASVGVLFLILVSGVLILNHVYDEREAECNACLEKNKFPCEYGNCYDYLPDVDDCCPVCLASLERTVED